MVRAKKGITKSDLPEGTVMHAGKMLCGTCKSRIRLGYSPRVIAVYDDTTGHTCKWCLRVQPLENFEPSCKGSSRLKSVCRICNILKYSYNITRDQYDTLLIQQNHSCAICKRNVDEFNRSLCVDHDHSCCPKAAKSCGKCVRGLLCQVCNQALGMFNDNPQVLTSAIKYLDHYEIVKE